MKNLKTFYYPETIDEVLDILRDETVKTAMVAGGTNISLSNDTTVEALVDITRAGLSYIKEEGGYIVIGATTTVRELMDSEIIKGMADGVLAHASTLIATHPLRNAITIGGNIVQLRIWSDLPTVLLALDAQVKVKGYEDRVIPAKDFFAKHPQKQLDPDEIVTEIVFPKAAEKSGAEFIKISRTKGDYAIISLGCYLEYENEKCTLARIAIGSALNYPKRARGAEAILEGNEITEDLVNSAAQKAMEEIKPISNMWGSAKYKKQLIKNLTRKAILSCNKKAIDKVGSAT
ncbi:MAG: FAD binding domain-containing protein [Candidatus Eremiobacteraeota bacterium]|nr:FAD binding domain-containing protein [Candidatus Eremiobacteraeota bacterium]